MPGRTARVAIWMAMAAVGVLLVLDVLYFAHGSLELFPTDEQQDKIRLVTGFFAVLLALAEIVLWLLLRRLGRTGIARGRSGAA